LEQVYGVLCHFQQYFSYIVVASLPAPSWKWFVVIYFLYVNVNVLFLDTLVTSMYNM
jgi:hypothetical protein